MAIQSQKNSRSVKARVKTGLCLHCDNEAGRRGLCNNHYTIFRNRRDAQPTAKDRAQFEIACIEDGKILGIGEARRIKGNDPFSGGA
jgi:hypothetical protein